MLDEWPGGRGWPRAATTHTATLGADFDAPATLASSRPSWPLAPAPTTSKASKARAEAAGHRQALTQCLTDAVKLVAAHYLHAAACAAAYFRSELLQPKESAGLAVPPVPAAWRPALPLETATPGFETESGRFAFTVERC